MKRILVLMMVVILAFTMISCENENTTDNVENESANNVENESTNNDLNEEVNNTVNESSNNSMNETDNHVEEETVTEDDQVVAHPIVTISFENYEPIVLELFPEIAPNTVNNFIALANDQYYDGLTFHRVIEGFMIQGGDPSGNGTGGPGYTIDGEFSKKDGDFVTYLSHQRGVISMARSQDPNSAGSQFFIMHKTEISLDYNYASFGKVTSGIETVDMIASVEIGEYDAPVEDVIMKTITVDLNGYEWTAPITN